MVQDSEILKPVHMIGALCFVTAVCAVLGFFHYSSEDMGFKIFAFLTAAVHLIVGVGILLRTGWGFSLLKGYLYFMMLGIPIGTMIAMRVLSHIKENDIKRFFGSNTLEL